MSLKQFETFYWPGLKAVILALVEKGMTPGIFLEGDYTARLEYLLELPRGKVLRTLILPIFSGRKKCLTIICASGEMCPPLCYRPAPFRM
jgi:hypothetical protein